MKIKTDKILFLLYFVLAFFTPIIYTGLTAELYEFPKIFFIYLIGLTILTIFIADRIINKDKKINYPDKLIVVYLFALIVSTIFSSHIYTSLWGYYSRFSDGLVSTIIFFGLYTVGINYFDKEKSEKIIDTCLLSLIPVTIYGISQSVFTNRVYSTFGQPNWLAAYLVILIPLLLEKILKQTNLFIRTAWSFLFLLAFICLWYTNSISGLLGIVISGIFLLVNFRKKLINKWGIILGIVVIIFISLNFSYIKNRFSDALTFSTDPGSYKISDPGLIRVGLWRGTLKMIFSSPKNFIIGVGPETFPYEYPFFRQNMLNYSSEWDFIMNKPHNYYLEMIAESGIFALILYCMILYKMLKSKNIFMSAGLAGFFVTNFFGWPTVYTSLLFWLFLAFISKKDIFR